MNAFSITHFFKQLFPRLNTYFFLLDKEIVVLVGLLGVVFTVLLLNAWVSEDAFITFRVIDNALSGHGLRWNVDERVQAYTHPLWLLLLMGVSFFTREIYITSIVVSLILTIIALAVGSFSVARSVTAAIFLLSATAMASPFVDFATSGLESPLAYALVALFVWLLIWRPNKIILLSIVSGLLILTRQDYALLVMPALFWIWWLRRHWSTIGMLILGMLPVFIWEIFSLIYYGFVFPNTAYAKLNIDIPRLEVISQGLRYMGDALTNHPLIIGVIVLGTVIAIVSEKRSSWSLMAGVWVYLAYIVWVGGDFMSGRFMIMPFWVAVLVSVSNFPQKKWATRVIFILLVILAGMSSRPIWTLTERHDVLEDAFRWNGIIDEKSFYFPWTGLFGKGQKKLTEHPWALEGLKANGTNQVVVQGNVGLYGYYAGPRVHIIDNLALTDPLLSRISQLEDVPRDHTTETSWRIGHFQRQVPEGYVESVQKKDNVIKNPDVASLYGDLILITQGKIWRLERFWKIAEYLLP